MTTDEREAKTAILIDHISGISEYEFPCISDKEDAELIVEALREKSEREKNEPLMLDELAKMKSTDWVWLTFPGIPAEECGWHKAKKAYFIFSHENYGKTWLAYRYKPLKGGE